MASLDAHIHIQVQVQIYVDSIARIFATFSILIIPVDAEWLGNKLIGTLRIATVDSSQFRQFYCIVYILSDNIFLLYLRIFHFR